MKKTTFLVPLFTAAALFAQSGTATNPQSAVAQDGASSHADHKSGRHRGMGRLSERLNLTPDQQQQVRGFFRQAAEAAKPIRSQLREQRSALQMAVKANSEQQIDQLTRQSADLRAQMQAIHAKAMAKVYSILTADQKAKFDALHSRTGRAHFQHERNG